MSVIDSSGVRMFTTVPRTVWISLVEVARDQRQSKVRLVESMLMDVGLCHFLLHACRLRLWMGQRSPTFSVLFLF